jgi:hypothetical protein
MTSPSQQREKRRKADNEEALVTSLVPAQVETSSEGDLQAPGGEFILPYPGTSRKKTISGALKTADLHAKSGACSTPSSVPTTASRIPAIEQFKFDNADRVFKEVVEGYSQLLSKVPFDTAHATSKPNAKQSKTLRKEHR